MQITYGPLMLGWQRAHESFLAEYAGYCKVELLEPSKALEMAARCVVETGTTTYYRVYERHCAHPFDARHDLEDDDAPAGAVAQGASLSEVSDTTAHATRLFALKEKIST